MSLPPGVVWVFLALSLGGCAAWPTDYPRPRSEALQNTDDTRIGREVAPLLVVHPGKSGVFTLGNGLDAFVARLALAEAADRTLDVQYYLFHDDVTGRLLAGYLLQAADIEALPDSAFGRRLSEAAITQRLADRNVDFFWGPARLLYDLPAKRHVWYG